MNFQISTAIEQQRSVDFHRSADFQVCCIADFQIRRASEDGRLPNIRKRRQARTLCRLGNRRYSRFGNLGYGTPESPLGLSATPGTAPAPVFIALTQAGENGIAPDIAADPHHFFVIANPMIEGFRLPKGFFPHPENLLRATGGKLLPRLHDFSQQKAGHWPDDNVRVVGHHDPLDQSIAFFVEKPERRGNELCNIRSPQVTGSRTGIEITLNFSLMITVDLLDVCGVACLRARLLDGAQSLSLLGFESHQHLFRHRIRQSESDEVVRALTFDVRQIPTGMNAGPKLVRSHGWNTVRAQLKLCPIQSAIQFFIWFRLRHARTISHRSADFQVCRLERSKRDCRRQGPPDRRCRAPEPIADFQIHGASEDRRRTDIRKCRKTRKLCRLGSRRYSRFGNLRYDPATFRHRLSFTETFGS